MEATAQPNLMEMEQEARRQLAGIPESVGSSGLKPCENRPTADMPTVTEIKNDTFEPLPLSCLPPVLRKFAQEVAASVGCDSSFVVLPALSVAAAAIGTSRSLMIKRDWFAPSILWAVCIGESGSQKSPPFRMAMAPLKERQASDADSYLTAYSQYQEDAQQHKQKLKQWQKTEGESGKDRPIEPSPPIRRRCIVQDSTMEALAPILGQNPRGLLLARDELSGWLSSFDKYSKGRGAASSDAPKWLEIYNGESITIDRKTGDQPFLYVKHPSVSIAGGIQPAILSQVLTEEHKANGLQSRLLMAFPPRQPKRWRDSEVSQSTSEQYRAAISDLFTLKPDTVISGDDKPCLLRLDADARQLFVDFVNRHGEEQNALSGHLASQWSKLEEVPARLAIVLHCLRQVTDNDVEAFTVDAATMQAAITLGEWFKTETLRINRLLTEDPETREARHLIDWIRSKGGTTTARDLCKSRRDIETAEEAELKLIHLVSIGAGQWKSLRTSREFFLFPVGMSAVDA